MIRDVFSLAKSANFDAIGSRLYERSPLWLNRVKECSSGLSSLGRSVG